MNAKEIYHGIHKKVLQQTESNANETEPRLEKEYQYYIIMDIGV